MAFCSRILAASIIIIIFTSTPVQPNCTVNSTQLHSNLLQHISNHFTNIINLQIDNSISLNKSILNPNAVGKNTITTKKSPRTNHQCYDHKMCCQPAVPTKHQVRLVEELINVLSLLDSSSIAQLKQVNDLYINKRNLTQWIVHCSCPTKYTSCTHKKGLLVAQCAYFHSGCHQVEVKVDNMFHHPVGCVHAPHISVEAVPRPTDFVSEK